jgi:XTP/dITP diphosphohydrolase
MKLLIGSSNKGKFIDMSAGLKDLALELLQPSDVGIHESPKEEGSTFKENATQKARFYFERSHIPTLADDSGIIVDVLKNELGIHTRRWGAGPDVSDHHWIMFFLDRMRGEKNRRATFVCCLCYIDAKGNEHYFDGECDGIITEDLEADYLPGLPIAACFKPNGADKVYAAMGTEGKNQWSHRGRALKLFHDYISQSA